MRVERVQAVPPNESSQAWLAFGETSQIQRARQSDESTQVVDRDKLDEAVQILNESSLLTRRHVEFHVHESTNRIMVRVINSETGEMIREIPPEQILNLVAKVQEIIGFLVDERV